MSCIASSCVHLGGKPTSAWNSFLWMMWSLEVGPWDQHQHLGWRTLEDQAVYSWMIAIDVLAHDVILICVALEGCSRHGIRHGLLCYHHCLVKAFHGITQDYRCKRSGSSFSSGGDDPCLDRADYLGTVWIRFWACIAIHSWHKSSLADQQTSPRHVKALCFLRMWVEMILDSAWMLLSQKLLHNLCSLVVGSFRDISLKALKEMMDLRALSRNVAWTLRHLDDLLPRKTKAHWMNL